MASYAKSKLPIVEFNEADLISGTISWKATSDTVRRALETYGCFVVVYNKVVLEESDALFNHSKELFGLPMETKTKHTSQLLGFGYEGNFPAMPLFECFGIEGDGTHEAAQAFTSLMWPQGNDNFCETLYSHSNLLLELYQTVMEMALSSYGLEKYHDPLIKSSIYMTRILKYRSPDKNESNIGLFAHRDKGFMAIVCTNEVKGLQIETPGGEWINFEPSPSKFVVIAGEAFTAWSNGRIYCPLHRVIIAREVKEKYSFAFFTFIGGTLQVPEELVDDETPLKFKSFNNLEFLEYCKKGGKTTIATAIQAYCGI